MLHFVAQLEEGRIRVVVATDAVAACGWLWLLVRVGRVVLAAATPDEDALLGGCGLELADLGRYQVRLLPLTTRWKCRRRVGRRCSVDCCGIDCGGVR